MAHKKGRIGCSHEVRNANGQLCMVTAARKFKVYPSALTPMVLKVQVKSKLVVRRRPPVIAKRKEDRRRWLKWVDTKTGKPGQTKGENKGKLADHPGVCHPKHLRLQVRCRKAEGQFKELDKCKRVKYNLERKKKSVRSSYASIGTQHTHMERAWYMKYNDCNLRISWHQVHKVIG